MSFNIGDVVSRKSYNNDILFIVIDIIDELYILKGVNVRLIADSLEGDLVICDNYKEDIDDIVRLFNFDLDRNDYFYLPGKVLHIDSDKDYLSKCLSFYKSVNIKAKGVILNENDIYDKVIGLIEEYNPNILVITGHDAYYKKMGGRDDSNNYKNSFNFIKSVNLVRKKYSYNDLFIIAGACQSNYEELIKAGANFASSPKRVNIHCLDPCIVASSIALSNKNSEIDIISIINKTKYGSDGIGGIISNGCCFKGYPR